MACIAVVLDGPKAKNGRRVFESFVEQNKQSFWNRELVIATEGLVYMGFMRPGTLFISGDSQYLNVLKDAWARRILKPAFGYTITSLGDLGAIQQVEQMHFVPLGDVICDAVAQLNRNGHAATENSIRQYVARHCAHVAPPGIEMVRQTLQSLLKTGFIYKMGDHFFVSVPTNSPPKKKNTVECQTGPSIITTPQPGKCNKRRSIFSRLFSRGIRPAAMPPVPAQLPPLPSPPTVPILPTTMPKTKYPTYHDGFEAPPVKEQSKRVRRRRRETAKLISSSSECLNYGPIDPPELLPPVEARKPRKRQAPKIPARREAIARTSTPIDTDSAYSPSPVTDSNDDCGCHSDPEINHTYINLAKLQMTDSTQFEDLTTADDKPQIHAMKGVLISNL